MEDHIKSLYNRPGNGQPPSVLVPWAITQSCAREAGKCCLALYPGGKGKDFVEHVAVLA